MSAFDKRLQPSSACSPPARNQFEAGSSVGQRPRIEFPKSLSALPPGMRQAGAFEHMQVFVIACLVTRPPDARRVIEAGPLAVSRAMSHDVFRPQVRRTWPSCPLPKKVGRRVDGRDKLPLVEEAGNGTFSTLSDGMLNKYPGMIKAAFINF
jgi:hypothetical protein